MRFNPTLEKIRNYEAGKPIELVVREFGIDESEVVKLASNENPYGASPKALEAIRENSHRASLYPDDSMYALKEGLARRFGVEREELIIGAGSDQVLEFAARALLNPQTKVLMTKVTFAMYAIYATQQGAEVVRTSCYRHDFDELSHLVREHDPAIVHICTPNNPTGDAVDREALYSFLEGVREPLVIVDGAYMEYAVYKDPAKKIDPKELIDRFPNVLYLGTFSKAYGLGGMRVGYGIARREIIRELSKLRPPFNVTTLSLAAAVAALEDPDFVESSLRRNFQEMDRYLTFALQRGIDYIDSYTNFITYLFDNSLSSTQIADELLKRGVIIRDLASYGINGIRITVGTREQNTIFFDRFGELLDGRSTG
ncbi:MAG: histidinol-phosphate transaminase [Epsilonproteobacteria bacterium]|nr:histidinol-phosphate transaminase [Campylobacterota bacterium]NPA57487.1 histidinol-phosphate transaminase [Campylobacterota bacterium]